MLKLMTPKIAFCSLANEERLRVVQPEIESLEKIIVLGTSDVMYAGVGNQNCFQSDLAVPVSHESVAILLSSSGTTGLPKCVQITYKNLHTVIASYL